MSRLLRLHDRVKIIKGDHVGCIGWIQRIEVEETLEVTARVLLTIELSRPYGQTIEALPSMVALDQQPQALARAA